MTKVILFGAGGYCRKFLAQMEHMDEEIQIVAIADNFVTCKYLEGHRIIRPEEILHYEFDKIIICLDDFLNLSAYKAVDSIINQLHSLGVEDRKIDLQNIYYGVSDRRVTFLQEYSRSVKNWKSGGGDVAECGVFRGHFAHYINKYFSDRTFYLFDTFSGFEAVDIQKEEGATRAYIENEANAILDNGSEGAALRRCREPQSIIVRKGYVPDTFLGLEDKKFVFVSLDMDLYKPTADALRWFSKRMVEGGVILVHDYLSTRYSGIKRAIDELEDECEFIRCYIGEMTMALIMKQEG